MEKKRIKSAKNLDIYLSMENYFGGDFNFNNNIFILTKGIKNIINGFFKIFQE